MSASFDFAQDIRKQPFALSLSKGRRFAQHRLCRSMNDIRNMTFYEFINNIQCKMVSENNKKEVESFLRNGPWSA